MMKNIAFAMEYDIFAIGMECDSIKSPCMKISTAQKKVRDLTTPLVTNVYLFWRDLTTPRVTYFHFGDQQCGQLLCCLSPARW